MKTIFNKFFTSKAELEAKKQHAWIYELAEMDDISALRLSTQKLNQLFETESFTTQQRLDLLMEIELVNHERLNRLASQFISTTNMKPELEAGISDVCYLYCRQSYISHLKLIEQVINPTKFKLEGEMPILIMARATYTATLMIKWRMFTQQPSPTKVWLQTYILYKIAHKQFLLSIPVTIFPGHPPTTLSAFIVQLCMLGQLQQANLQKTHLEIAHKLLTSWLGHAHISTKYTPEQYLFYVNLEQDIPAKRMRKIEANEHCRYWEINDLEKQIQVALNTSARGEYPPSLAGVKIDNIKHLHETLDMLLAEWRRENYVRQRRKEPRQATSKTAKVKAGIDNICDQVLQANQIGKGLRIAREAKSLDALLRGHTVLKQTTTINLNTGSLDTWIITDQSPRGLGARVNKYANILARPDKLISLVFEDDLGAIVIGMIKTAKPTQGNQLKVGVEIMSRQALWVQLQPAEDNQASFDAVSEINIKHRNAKIDAGLFSGIYLPAESDGSTEACLILPKISYRPNIRYTLHIAGKSRRVVLEQPIESRDDWVRVAIPAK